MMTVIYNPLTGDVVDLVDEPVTISTESHEFVYIEGPFEQQRFTNAVAAKVQTKVASILYACDFTQLEDAPTKIDKAAWRAYRQALRDVNHQEGFPFNVAWPDPPNV